MISAGIIAFMLMIIIYIVIRTQGLQREIKLATNAGKTSSRKLKQTQKQLVFMAHELQSIFKSRLESLNKRGLIKQDDYQIAFFIINRFEFVVMNCSEHGTTVEEAVNKSLQNQAIKIEQINDFIKAQASEVRMAWCQNQLDGYVAACRGISTGSLNTKAADSAAVAEAE